MSRTIIIMAAVLLLACSPQGRSTVTITQRGGWYVAEVTGPHASRGLRVGGTAAEAAAIATRLMLQHAVENPSGGVLIAPTDVLDLVPAHLRDVPAVPR